MTNRILLTLSLTLALMGCGSGSHEHGDDQHAHAGGEDTHHHHEGEHHDHEDADGDHHHHDGEHHDHEGAEAEHGHDGGEHEHGEMHPALHAYHEVLAPAWHADEGAPRVAASCEASPELVERAGPLGAAMTENQTEAGAETPGAASEALSAAATGLAERCAAEPRDDTAVEAAIAEVHDRFHTIMEALQAE